MRRQCESKYALHRNVYDATMANLGVVFRGGSLKKTDSAWDSSGPNYGLNVQFNPNCLFSARERRAVGQLDLDWDRGIREGKLQPIGASLLGK